MGKSTQSDAGKRFCSLTFVLVQTEHSHRLSLFLEAKENKYHWFQRNAWTDRGFCTKWAKRILKTVVQGKYHFVLFCDNLE